MSYADNIFKKRCEEILTNGESSEGTIVRPKWADGTPAHTLHITNVVNEYDLREEFPIMTLRRTPLKSCIDEVLWIYQKKSNNVNDLNSHVWDSWADEYGSIGTAYGYQIAKKTKYPDGEFDQMDRVLYDLKNTPSSRRIMTNTYQFDDLPGMQLYPCAYSCTYNVFKGELNMILNQRSQDMLAASNWNVAQYAALLTMVSTAVGLKPGRLTHVISDCHIYDRHIPLIEELISRRNFIVPLVSFTPKSDNFYDFAPDDWSFKTPYSFGDQITFPIAI